MKNEKITKNLMCSIVATGLLSFSGIIIETAMNITFPRLMKLFGVPLSTIQWLTTSYLLVLSIMMPLSTYLKRRFKVKKLFIVAALFFLAGLLLDAIAPSLAILIVGRVLQGIGTGISLPMMFNIILEQAPSNRQGLLIGVGNFITATAPAIGPTLGGLLVDSAFGWRMIFWVMVPVVAIALILGATFIQQKSPTTHVKLDVIGWVNLAGLFGFLIIALTQLGQNRSLALIDGVIALFFLASTLIWYRKAKAPIIKLSLFKNSWFSAHLIGYMLCQFSVMGLAFLLPNLVQIMLKQSSFTAGLIMLPGAALGALLSPVGGGLFDRYGAPRPILIGISLEAIAVIGDFLVFRNATALALALIYMIFTLGQGTGVPNILTSGLQPLTPQESVDGNAIFNTLQQFAGAAGTSIISIVIGADHTTTQANGFGHGLLILIGCLVLNLVILSVTFSRRHPKAPAITDAD